jgi:hypothetical protein
MQLRFFSVCNQFCARVYSQHGQRDRCRASCATVDKFEDGDGDGDSAEAGDYGHYCSTGMQFLVNNGHVDDSRGDGNLFRGGVAPNKQAEGVLGFFKNKFSKKVPEFTIEEAVSVSWCDCLLGALLFCQKKCIALPLPARTHKSHAHKRTLRFIQKLQCAFRAGSDYGGAIEGNPSMGGRQPMEEWMRTLLDGVSPGGSDLPVPGTDMRVFMCANFCSKIIINDGYAEACIQENISFRGKTSMQKLGNSADQERCFAAWNSKMTACVLGELPNMKSS